MATSARNASLVTKLPEQSTVVPMVSGGPSTSRPANPPLGYLYYDTTLDYEVVWNGRIWRALVPTINESVGFGDTAGRPRNPKPGFLYYDTTLKQEIVWDGTAWVVIGPAAGTSPSSVPVITSQPSSQTVTVGQVALFAVTATSTTALSFQWQKNGVAISGANATSYTTPSTILGDSGSTFACIVTNAAGSVTSSTATLTVSASAVAPVITSDPSNTSAIVGDSATFAIAATGTTPLAYQWYKNTIPLLGATTSTYITPPVADPDNGAAYYCTVVNSAGMATSASATLTVTPRTPVSAGLIFTNFSATGVANEEASLVAGFIVNSADSSSMGYVVVSNYLSVFPAGVTVTVVGPDGAVLGTQSSEGGEAILGTEFTTTSNGGYTIIASKTGENAILTFNIQIATGTAKMQNASLRGTVYGPVQYPPDGFALELTIPTTSGTGAGARFTEGTNNTTLSSPDYSWNLNGNVSDNPVAITPGGQIGCTGSTALSEADVRLDVYST